MRRSTRRTTPYHAAVAAGFASLLVAVGTQAGSATIDAGDGSTATFEYRDDMLRINNSVDASSYAVVRDGSLYTVSLNNGQPMVIDAGAMMKGMGAMDLPAPTTTSDLDGTLISLEDTGRNETVAGIEGDVYQVRFEDASGMERSETLVLSTDKRVLEFNDAMLQMVSVAAELASTEVQEQGQDFQNRLQELNAGVLRFGDQMQIISLSGDPVPEERFALPAAPMDIRNLGSMLGNFPLPNEPDNN